MQWLFSVHKDRTGTASFCTYSDNWRGMERHAKIKEKNNQVTHKNIPILHIQQTTRQRLWSILSYTGDHVMSRKCTMGLICKIGLPMLTRDICYITADDHKYSQMLSGRQYVLSFISWKKKNRSESDSSVSLSLQFPTEFSETTRAQRTFR